jgi:hypothetical protein
MLKLYSKAPIIGIILDLLVCKNKLSGDIGNELFEKLKEIILKLYKNRMKEQQFYSVLQNFQRDLEKILSSVKLDLAEYYKKKFITYEYVDPVRNSIIKSNRMLEANEPSL